MTRCISILILSAFIAVTAYPKTYSLYGDKKAKKIDDVITVMIVEDAQATNKTKTGTNTQTDVGFGTNASNTGLMRFLPNWNFSGQDKVEYRGDGETSRTGVFKARVTARVVEVHDNGNLLIQGSKLVEINNEKEMIHVSGIIRPEDIGSDNTIYSYSIADAKITYTGEGVNQDAQKPGIFTRFFTWLF